MEIGYDLDNFSIKKYKEILENSSKTLTDFQERRLIEEIEDTQKEIEMKRNKLMVMKKILEYNNSKKK